MTFFFLLLADGVSYLLLTDGTSKLIIETVPAFDNAVWSTCETGVSVQFVNPIISTVSLGSS